MPTSREHRGALLHTTCRGFPVTDVFHGVKTASIGRFRAHDVSGLLREHEMAVVWIISRLSDSVIMMYLTHIPLFMHLSLLLKRELLAIHWLG